MLQVEGRSDLFLKLEIIKKFVFLGPIVLGIFCGIYSMLIANVFCGFIAYYLNAYYSGSFLNYTIKEQVKDIMPSFLVSVCMGLIVYAMSFLPINYYILLPMQVIVGALVFIGLCKLFKLDEYEECKSMISVYFNKIKHYKS